MIFYGNGDAISSIQNIDEAADLDELVKSSGGIPSKLISEDTLFEELKDRWLKILILEMQKDESLKVNFQTAFYGKSVTYDNVEHLLERCGKKLFAIDRQFWPTKMTSLIKKAVCNNTYAIPPCYCMRLGILCILTGLMPEELLSEGTAWPVSFQKLSETGDGYINVKQGDYFSMESQECQKLFPVTLKNDSNESVSITIKVNSEEKNISLPPYGILRAVAADEKATALVGVKGSISMGKINQHFAYLQKGEKNLVQLKNILCRTERTIKVIQGILMDAAAWGDGNGVLILTQNMMADSLGRIKNVQRKEIPIRCYGAGGEYALLYDDGNAITNIKGMENLRNVIAIVEDGSRGLLIEQSTNQGIRYLDCRYGKWNGDITAQVFFNLMLMRFSDADFCEKTGNDQMMIGIDSNGGIVRVR